MKKNKPPDAPNVTIADVVALIRRTLVLREGISPSEVKAIAADLHNAALDCLGAVDAIGAGRDRQRLAARLAKLPDDEMLASWRGPEVEAFPFFRSELREAAWALGLDTDAAVKEWLRAALVAIAEGEPADTGVELVAQPTAATVAHAASVGAVIELKRPWRAKGKGRPSSDHSAICGNAVAAGYTALTGRPATRWTGDGKTDPATLQAGSFKLFGCVFCRTFGVAIEVTRTLAGPAPRK